MSKIILIIAILVITNLKISSSQTDIDRVLLTPWKSIKNFLHDLANRNSRNIHEFSRKHSGKMQAMIPKSEKFYCDTRGFRSNVTPSTVDEIRPGDIDIIAAMGDSITAANGAISRNLIHALVESRGVSFSIGGMGTWRTYWTLPNFLKEFNPNLYGYSIGNALSYDRRSRFNVAEPATLSADLLYQAKILHQRLRADRKVNMTENWKLLTILNGHNDFCQMCSHQDPRKILKSHKKDMIETLRYLRDNIPRLIVNWVSVSNIIKGSFELNKGVPEMCVFAQKFECSCLFKTRFSKNSYDLYHDINSKWHILEHTVVNMDEFHSKDFTINFQPLFLDAPLPLNSDGTTDLTFFSDDCFHLSQKGHAAVANSLFNNMFQAEGEKDTNWVKSFKKFVCPTKEKPFLITRTNKS